MEEKMICPVCRRKVHIDRHTMLMLEQSLKANPDMEFLHASPCAQTEARILSAQIRRRIMNDKFHRIATTIAWVCIIVAIGVAVAIALKQVWH